MITLALPQKKHFAFITVLLWLCIIYGSIAFFIKLYTLSISISIHYNTLLYGLNVIGTTVHVGGAYLLLKWKKMGFYLFAACIGITGIAALLKVSTVEMVIVDAVTTLVWLLLLLIRKKGVSTWSQLENGWYFNNCRPFYIFFGIVLVALIIITILASIPSAVSDISVEPDIKNENVVKRPSYVKMPQKSRFPSDLSLDLDKVKLANIKGIFFEKQPTKNIDNNAPVANNEENISLYDRAMALYKKGLYHEARDIFADLYYISGPLSDEGLAYYAACKFNIKEDIEGAIDLLSQIRDYSWVKKDKLNPYVLKGWCYNHIGEYYQAISAIEDGLAWRDNGNKDYYSSYLILSLVYYNLENYDRCLEYAWIALDFYAKYNNTSSSSLWKKCTGNGFLGYLKNRYDCSLILECIVDASEANYLWSQSKANKVRKVLASKGFENFIKYCNANNI